MPNTPRGFRPDPMAREVDRLLAKLAGVGSTHAAGAEPHRSSAPRPAIRSNGRPRPRPRTDDGRYDRVALWARVVLGVLLGALITQWPYARACGWPLIMYLASVGTIMIAGGWIAVTSWKEREAAAHALSLILLFWGIVLTAEQLLPRMGYAALTATWKCGAEPWLPFIGM